MNVYLYQAALLCEQCGDEVRKDLTDNGEAPENPDDEATFDSDDFPKGPYSDGGGEADCPQHCDYCQCFLDNPLTSDGYDYVRKAIRKWEDIGSGSEDVLREWSDRYDIPMARRDDDIECVLQLARDQLDAMEREKDLDDGVRCDFENSSRSYARVDGLILRAEVMNTALQHVLSWLCDEDDHPELDRQSVIDMVKNAIWERRSE